MLPARTHFFQTTGRLLCLGLVLAASLTTIQATTVKRMTVPDMLNRADDVAHVRVVANKVRTDPDTHYHWTVTTFQVLEGVKGAMRPGELFDVEVIGGEAPGSGYATVVAGAPRFAQDEEVVLFSYNTRDGRQQPVGFFQGAIRLRLTPEGSMVLIQQASVTDQVVPAGATGRAPLHRVGEPAPDADPTVGRSQGAVRRLAGSGNQAAAAGVNHRVVPVEDFMASLHSMAAAAREERP